MRMLKENQSESAFVSDVLVLLTPSVFQDFKLVICIRMQTT